MNTAPAAKITTTCDRCDGQCHIQGFGHYANGTCFLCHGAGVRKVTPYVAPAQTPEQIEAAAKAEAEQARRVAWAARFDSADLDDVVTFLRTLSWERAFEIRQWSTCGTGEGHSPVLPGCRELYWAACARCDAWAFGPLPRSWVTASTEPVTVTRFAAT